MVSAPTFGTARGLSASVGASRERETTARQAMGARMSKEEIIWHLARQGKVDAVTEMIWWGADVDWANIQTRKEIQP